MSCVVAFFFFFFKTRKRKEAEEQRLSRSPAHKGILSGVGAPSVGAEGKAGASLALSSSKSCHWLARPGSSHCDVIGCH